MKERGARRLHYGPRRTFGHAIGLRSVRGINLVADVQFVHGLLQRLSGIRMHQPDLARWAYEVKERPLAIPDVLDPRVTLVPRVPRSTLVQPRVPGALGK